MDMWPTKRSGSKNDTGTLRANVYTAYYTRITRRAEILFPPSQHPTDNRYYHNNARVHSWFLYYKSTVTAVIVVVVVVS